jgi:type II restriction enzyme
MRIITAKDIVKAISRLPKNQAYYYVNPSTRTILKIEGITLPEGPITIKRWDPEKGQTEKDAQEQSISTQMIWRIANAIRDNVPVNFDRVLGGSYNTRSALEALMAHTTEFYVCWPGRIESISASTEVKRGHKHLVWKPNQPHELGVIKETDTDIVISEIPGQEVVYDSLGLTSANEEGLDIEIARRHAQIQIALIMIGQHLNYRTWVAKNDMGIIYKQKRLAELEGVIPSLSDNTLISPWHDAVKAALLIDVIWFKNGRLMPAVIEVEHTTGVTSGLTRMKKFQDVTPPIMTRYVIAASDEDREKVMQEISHPQFKSLNAKFFPYSAIEELWALCERRKIQGVTDEFLDSFMESPTSN